MEANRDTIDAKLKRITVTKGFKKPVPYYLEDRWPNVAIRDTHGHPFRVKL